jgi:hypothetical protein
MELKNQDLEILDEGQDAMAGPGNCCPAGSSAKIK